MHSCMNTSYASLLPTSKTAWIESVKNVDNIEAMTTLLTNSLDTYSFESKPSPNKEPIIINSTVIQMSTYKELSFLECVYSLPWY